MSKWHMVVVILAASLLGILLFVSLGRGNAVIAQDGPGPYSGQPQYPSSTQIFTCTISEIAVHQNTDRIHIRCNPGDGAISFFVAPSGPGSTEVVRANQFLTLANTAYALGKTINIWYETNQTLNPPGCLTTDCRGIIALVLRQ